MGNSRSHGNDDLEVLISLAIAVGMLIGAVLRCGYGARCRKVWKRSCLSTRTSCHIDRQVTRLCPRPVKSFDKPSDGVRLLAATINGLKEPHFL